MLNKILKTFFFVFFVLVAVILQMLILNFFDFPFSRFNFIVALLSIILMYNSHGKVVWFSFLVFFILDLFSANNFGFIFFSGTISTLIIYWFFRELFSKQTIWSLALMCLLFLIFYNLIYLTLNLFLSSFSLIGIVDYTRFFQNLLFEIIITVIFTLILYVVFDFILKKINKKYILN